MNSRSKTHTIAVIGLMAAMVFVATNLRIDIPTPLGKTMIHFGNIFCILAGLTLGGKKGALAAGIGSMFFDLVDPAFISSAPYTLVFKGMMAYVAGTLAFPNGDRENTTPTRLAVASIAGAVTYVILYLSKGVISDLFFYRHPIETVITVTAQKGIVSLTNGIIAVIVALVLYPTFIRAMKISGVYDKIHSKTATSLIK